MSPVPGRDKCQNVPSARTCQVPECVKCQNVPSARTCQVPECAKCHIHTNKMLKLFVFLVPLAALAAARSAYQFSTGYLDVLGAEPTQSFDCTDKPYGYYADVASDCRVFHICIPVADDEGTVVGSDHFSFFCGNQTVFNQESLICSHQEDASPCSEAEALYQISNSAFGIIPEAQN
ncbi:hypothetical protein Pmani_016038 [Petrolisthes manimaculis]|uniref:Chitin-binding type-2 domain-containing protein n=1 Tax=Petrolisthes manimaculis TaxID=1843537 RepID=A0AAE1UBF2_9EUCA|nr:hypothetical protein Pmani_016038 [Petrolisthes manimaculis]